EHAINKNQLLRVEYSRNNNDQDQLGVGGFDLYERAYDRQVRGNEFRVSTSGPVFHKMRNEVRLEADWDDTVSTSLSDAQIVSVKDAFTTGGAQIAGGRKANTLEFADNLDFALGKKHALRAGLLIQGGSFRSDESRNYNGTYTFASNDAFLAGEPLQFSQRFGDPLVEYRSFQFGAYLQDDFRVKKSLLLSYGLRYEAQTHLGDNINLSPRVSFAWTPFKSGSTTLRGGFGVFNDWYDDSLYEQALRLDGEHQRDLIVRNPTYPAIDLSGAAQLAPSVTRIAGDLVMPQITRASFGVEHAFTNWAQFRSNYFIQRSDEFRAVNLNSPIDGVRPLPAFGIITYVDTIGEAKSQGIDLSMNLNYAPKRIFGTINYRLAKAMNDGDSATSLPMNSADLAAEWGPARNDVRHRIFGFVSMPLKYGLRSNVNMRYESGLPYNITTGFDDNGDDVSNDRPAGVSRNSARGDGLLNLDLRLSWQKSIGQARDPGPGAPGGPGGGPVVIRAPGGGPGGGGGGGRGGPGGGGGFGGGFGPGAGNGRVNVELFAQVTNLTNTVNLRNYSGVLTSNFFGQPTASAEPRRVELGMRFGF
ncbi:MAG: TonB-dependent receptor domain-containing protein, partial [Catenulispora sp.]